MQSTLMSSGQESIPISIRQELEQKFLTGGLLKLVIIRALAALPNVPNSYKCDTCGKIFSSFQALGGHKSIHNTNNKKNRDEPTKIFIAKPLKRPRFSETETTSEKPLECGICGKIFSTYQALGGHKSIHNTNNKRTCDEPTKIFIAKPQKCSRSSEIETASEKLFECGICSKTFSTYQALKGHKSIHSTNNKRTYDEPTKIFITKPQKCPKSSETETETASKKSFECDICSKTFSTYKALGGHKGIHKRASYKPVSIVPRYLQLFPKSISPILFSESASSFLNETREIDLELRL